MTVINILYDGLTEREIEQIYALLPFDIPFKRGEELYKNGLLGIITKGKASIKRISSTGQPLVIRTLFEGDIFGAASIFGSWKEGASSVIAETDGQIVYINESDFKNILESNKKVVFNYIKYLTDRIRFLNRRIDAFSANSTEQRLYEFLLSQKNEKNDVYLNISMARLAEMLNVGRTSLYRDLAALESKKLIKRDKKIIHITER